MIDLLTRLLTTATILATTVTAHAQGTTDANTGASAGLEEIVVTARKRAERLQDVPIAVTAFTPESLERQNFTSALDLTMSVPNMVVYSSVGTSASAQFYIRGVGQDDAIFTAEQGVGVYLDGVLLAKQQGSLLDLIEFERIEVLRGPQGTLYGRNSTTGAVKFVTKRPDLDVARAVADVTVGSYNRFDQRGTINVPVVPGKFALKFDGLNRQSDGYLTDLAHDHDINGIDRQMGRVSALWAPSEVTKVYTAVDIANDGSGITVVTPLMAGAGQGGYVPVHGSPYKTNHSVPNLQDTESGGLVLDVEHEFDWALFKSTTGYRMIDQQTAYDGDGSLLTTLDIVAALEQNQISQEFQLVSNDTGRLRYTAGVFFFREDIEVDAENIFQGTNNFARQVSTSNAVYVDGSYALNDTVSLSAGARYTWDDKEIDQLGWSRATGAQIIDVDKSLDFTNFSPRAGLDWKVTPDTLLYVSAARGYKAGGFSQGRPANQQRAETVYQPETVMTYELGVKTDLLDRRLRLNANYFFSDYEDMQLTFLQNGVFFVDTADVELQGIELEANAQVTDGLMLRLVGSWLDGEYTHIPLIPGTSTYVGGLFPDAQVKQVPEYSYKVGGTYELPLGGVGRLQANIDYTWNDIMFHNAGNAMAVATPQTGVLDAQLSFLTSDDKWRFAVGGRNITDEVIVIGGNAPNLARFYGTPATWYATATFRY